MISARRQVGGNPSEIPGQVSLDDEDFVLLDGISQDEEEDQRVKQQPGGVSQVWLPGLC